MQGIKLPSHSSKWQISYQTVWAACCVFFPFSFSLVLHSSFAFRFFFFRKQKENMENSLRSSLSWSELCLRFDFMSLLFDFSIRMESQQWPTQQFEKQLWIKYRRKFRNARSTVRPCGDTKIHSFFRWCEQQSNWNYLIMRQCRLVGWLVGRSLGPWKIVTTSSPCIPFPLVIRTEFKFAYIIAVQAKWAMKLWNSTIIQLCDFISCGPL